MHSVLITNPDGKIILSRYFEPPNDGSDYANSINTNPFEHAARLGEAGRRGASLMRDRSMAMRWSESEVLGQTRHLWTKGTAKCPQVARAKVRWDSISPKRRNLPFGVQVVQRALLYCLLGTKLAYWKQYNYSTLLIILCL